MPGEAPAVDWETRLRHAVDHIDQVRLKAATLAGARENATQQINAHRTSLDSALHNAEVAEQARQLLEKLTDAKRELVREKIEALVTHGLRAVYGETYSFRIEQGSKRNQVTFTYRIVEHYAHGVVRESDLRGSHGGGLVALVGLLLRITMVVFSHPTRRRTLLLDETLAALDGDKRAATARLLQELGQQLEMQFVLVTHSEEYIEDADVAYEIKPNGEHARLVKIK